MVHGYKGFESDMTCRGFQYEVGLTYTYRQKILPWRRSISLCKRGFHFCRKIADVLNYYDGHDCRYAVVEALGEVIDGDDKSVTDKLRIVRELTWTEVLETMYSQADLELKSSPFPADEIIKARENGTLDKLLPSRTEFPVRFSNGEWNVLVVCRDRGHTYLVTKYLMAETFAMNGDMTSKGGWPACGMREHVRGIYDMLPEDIKKALIPMHIKQLARGTAVECDDMAFLLSATNVFGANIWNPSEDCADTQNIWNPSEDCADTQIDIFREASHREKGHLGASSASWWWLRSAYYSHYFPTVYYDGSYYYYDANYEGGVVVGFCIESRA